MTRMIRQDEFTLDDAGAKTVFTYSHAGQSRLRRGLIRAVEAATGRRTFERLYQSWINRSRDPGRSVFTDAVAALEVWPDVTKGEIANIPAKGALLVIANHPFGIVDGLMAGHLVSTVRRDVKLMVHSLLCRPPEVKDVLLPVDFGHGADARRTSAETRRKAVEWLDAGHVLIIFPAGGVSTAKRPTARRAVDPAWHPFVARLAQRPGVKVVPVFFHGQNSRLFQIVSHFSYPLRVALLFSETRRLMRKAVPVAIGQPVDCTGMDKSEVLPRLRELTFGLAGKAGPGPDEEFVFPAHIRW